MGGKASKQEDLEWGRTGDSRTCGSYVLDTASEAPRPATAGAVDQFLRVATAWDGSKSSVLGMKQSHSGEDGWVRGFWAGIHVVNNGGKENEHRCCLLIDVAAIFIFSITISNCCCSIQTGDMLRVPLRNISAVQKLESCEGGVPVRIAWKAQFPDFDDSGELLWRSSESNVTGMMGQLYDSIQLLNYGGVSEQVSF